MIQNYSKRNFSAYELNWLLKHGYSISDLDKYGDKPVEYITSKAQFIDLEFSVTEDVLIPRIETEDLVQLVINEINLLSKTKSEICVADVGTGSGAIGISLVNHFKDNHEIKVKMIMSDISTKALEVAKKNAKELLSNKDQDLITFLQSDLLSQYPDNLEIDILVANLPYIPTTRINDLEKNVIEYEPLLALDGGSKYGLELIEKSIHQAELRIKRPSIMLFEIDEFVQDHHLSKSKIYSMNLTKDSFEATRFLILRRMK